MEKIIKTVIEVEVTNLQVTEKSFSFDYKILKDGKLAVEDKYQGDHTHPTDAEGFKKFLEDGHALKTAMFLFSLED